MNFEAKVLAEPELEFGDGFTHFDPRFGLSEAGPMQSYLGETIRVGVIGSTKTIEDAKKFFEKVEGGLEGGSEKHPNMHPLFPGLRNANPFRCKFEVVSGPSQALSQSKIDRISKTAIQSEAVTLAVDEIVELIRTFEEGSGRPDVIVVALPQQLIERVWNNRVEEGEDSEASDIADHILNFRGLLKAKCMFFRSPIQIVWEDVIDKSTKISNKVKIERSRKVQEDAAIAWNMLPALFYKGSGRIPWRKAVSTNDYPACYIGVSFYREAGGKSLYTSAAQMFDERGRGFILRGRRAHTESSGRHPYMNFEDAGELIRSSLNAFRNHHKHLPARVIVLKTSQFREEEADGMLAALAAVEIEFKDLVWVQESVSIKLLRDGSYPVMRGTFVDLGRKGILYTQGSVPYYSTYPGLYDPRPLLICPHRNSDSTLEQLAKEILAMTKVNWNSTQLNQKLPIPIRAARAVGEVLKYVPADQVPTTDYAKYM